MNLEGTDKLMIIAERPQLGFEGALIKWIKIDIDIIQEEMI